MNPARREATNKTNEHRMIYLVTTPGCEGCRIMQRILDEVHAHCLYTFSLTTLTKDTVPEYIKDSIKLTDFPTVIFVKNKEIVYHFVGSKPFHKILALVKQFNFN